MARRRLTFILSAIGLVFALHLSLSNYPQTRPSSLPVAFVTSRVDLPPVQLHLQDGTTFVIAHNASWTSGHQLSEKIDGTKLTRWQIPPELQATIVAVDGSELWRGGSGSCKQIAHCKEAVSIQLEWDLKTSLANLKTLEGESILHFPHIGEHPDDAVTLVVQMSVDRLPAFLSVLQAGLWDGPVSLAIYLTFHPDIEILQNLLHNPNHVNLLKRASITILKPDYSDILDVKLLRLRYPINRLRNLATNNAPTKFILLIDGDFIPSPNLHDILRRTAVPTIKMVHAESPTLLAMAIAVPCFIVKDLVTNVYSKQELVQSIDNASLVLPDQEAGHGLTRPTILRSPSRPFYWSWNTQPYQSTETFSTTYEPQWEPYYVLHKSSCPLYDERFTDQGGDKQSHASILNALGFHFRVLRDGWLIHPPKSAKKGEDELWPIDRAMKDEGKRVEGAFFSSEMLDRFGWKLQFPNGAAANLLRPDGLFGRPGPGIAFGI